MNKVFLIGNLTRDPEYHELPTGTKVCNISIAVSKDFGEEGADFFNIKVWGKQAENCHKYLAKGRKVGVVGRLQNRSYEDKDGVNRTVTEINAQEVEFLSSREDNEGSQNETKATSIRTPQANFLEPIDDNQLPF